MIPKKQSYTSCQQTPQRLGQGGHSFVHEQHHLRGYALQGRGVDVVYWCWVDWS